MAFDWPWHFVLLASPAEKQQRRELLDLRGFYAQVSAVIVISLLRLYESYNRAVVPIEKTRPRDKQKSWWNSPPVARWTETRRQYAVALIWLTWLVALSMWKTGDDYLHLTKALGHVGLSQVPVQVLMSPALYLSASKPAASSVVSVLTGISQPTLTAYHRLFGRLVLSPLLVGHAVLYVSFFAQSSHPEFSSLLAKRLQDDDVQCGLFAIMVAVSVLLFVRPVGNPRWLRGWSTGSQRAKRQAFYITHLLLVGVFALSAYYHVAQAQGFVLQALGAFIVNVGCCWIMAR
ncbi:hypothetical protein BDV59DRAFT_110347 [Aspergillus ambiguus]|uniref:ferric reductase-like transmembrane domain-containing protein n=1 Tax=Aspergillus ambiguus TaxID=176160 RepID=UPI003CCD2D97